MFCVEDPSDQSTVVKQRSMFAFKPQGFIVCVPEIPRPSIYRTRSLFCRYLLLIHFASTEHSGLSHVPDYVSVYGGSGRCVKRPCDILHNASLNACGNTTLPQLTNGLFITVLTYGEPG
jgi:hypothetical protein